MRRPLILAFTLIALAACGDAAESAPAAPPASHPAFNAAVKKEAGNV